jgi:hypothetical protein
MATTTNYGWTTPDDTALVKDGASAIRTLGSSVDTTTKALNPSTTLGDIEYRSSTANTNTRLGIGTNGQVLTVAGGVPSWAAAGLTSGSATVATDQTTTSTSYTDLATAGPAVTLTTGTKALVIISCEAESDGINVPTFASVAVSGATTIAASDTIAIKWQLRENIENRHSVATRFTTLTAGSNTFTVKYRTTSDTASFGDREIIVIDLGS